jgi:hypothetical protein
LDSYEVLLLYICGKANEIRSRKEESGGFRSQCRCPNAMKMNQQTKPSSHVNSGFRRAACRASRLIWAATVPLSSIKEAWEITAGKPRIVVTVP